MDMVVWTRRDAAPNITQSKLARLREIGFAFSAARAAYVAEHWPERYAARVLCSPRRLVEERRKAGWPSNSLGATQNKIVLESALAVIKSSWARTFRHVRRLVYANRRLSHLERRWLAYVMRWPVHLQTILDNESVYLTEPWAEELNQAALSRRLRRLIRRYRQPFPSVRGRGQWFELDTNLYRVIDRSRSTPSYRADSFFRGAWIAVTGLRSRERILVPLAGRGLDEFAPRTARSNSRPRVRVRLDSEQIVCWVAVRRPIPAQRAGIEAGLDKGYATLLTLSTGDPASGQSYGAGSDLLLGPLADSYEERKKQRNRIRAYERSIRNGDPGKARRIRRSNLSSRRTSRASRIEKAHLREHVDKTLNELFRVRQDLGKLHVEQLNFPSRRLSRQMNRRLRRWLKGYLHRRLAWKARLNGVELNVVNAAYTSQICPRCGFVSSKNRSGARFECGHCGFTGSADAVAATNILRRGSDEAITRLTPPMRVRQILEERWRSARNGRAWGSNGGHAVDRETSRDGETVTEPRTTDGASHGDATQAIHQDVFD